MKYITLIIIAGLLGFVQCQCNDCGGEDLSGFILHFHNTSDYEIDVSAHKIASWDNRPHIFYIFTSGPIEPHSVEGREIPGGGGR